jgi:hypothetical protein
VATNFTIATSRAELTSQQEVTQTTVWETNGKGVYPSVREDVKSGSRFIVCPVSTSWCASPAIIDTSTTHLNITTLSLGCISRQLFDINTTIDIALQLEASSDPSSAIDLAHIAPCTPIESDNSNNIHAAPIAFQCDLSGITISSYLNVGDVHLHILWKPSAEVPSVSSYAAVGETVLPVPVIYETMASSTSTCALNKAIPSCDQCAVCNSHTTPAALSCLALTCPAGTDYITNTSFFSFSSSQDLQSLYASPSCSQSCANTFIEEFDKNHECCAVEDIDCIGDCNGGATVGISEVGGYARCCRVDEPADCEGVCGGPAVIDTCNVCKGNDTGIRCPTGVAFDTGSNVFNSDKHLATMYDAVNSTYGSVVPITVFNSFNTSVFVIIEEVVKQRTTTKKNGPVFDLSGITQEIEGNQNYTFYIASNISGLFSGMLGGWEVKTLSLR